MNLVKPIYQTEVKKQTIEGEELPPAWAKELLDTIKANAADAKLYHQNISDQVKLLRQDVNHLTTCVATLAEADIRQGGSRIKSAGS